MPLDGTEKKLFAQFDDPGPGHRQNALEMLRERRLKKKPAETFVDLLAEFDGAVPRAQYDAAMQANAALSLKYRAAMAQLGVLKGVLAFKIYWQQALAMLALPVLGLGGYYAYSVAHASEAAALDAGFSEIATSASWSEISDSDAHPVIREVNGTTYWVIFRRDQNTDHVNDNDAPVIVQCVRVFASPATDDAGVHLKPRPYALWGWGWLTWPESASDCRTNTARQVADAKHPFQFHRP